MWRKKEILELNYDMNHQHKRVHEKQQNEWEKLI